MKEKTEVNDINENIYNFKKKNDYSYETIGLTPEIIKEISEQKNEPKWMLNIRLKALETFNKLSMPTWGPDLSELDMSKIATYVKPKAYMKKSWDDVPEDIRDTFDKLGIPELAEDLDGLGYLQGKDVDFVNKKATDGVLLAHTDGDVPNMFITIPEQDAFTLGYIIYFFELAIALSGYLNAVNPFNQPGVEAYKKNMFALLGKPGFEELGAELNARL